MNCCFNCLEWRWGRLMTGCVWVGVVWVQWLWVPPALNWKSRKSLLFAHGRLWLWETWTVLKSDVLLGLGSLCGLCSSTLVIWQTNELNQASKPTCLFCHYCCSQGPLNCLCRCTKAVSPVSSRTDACSQIHSYAVQLKLFFMQWYFCNEGFSNSFGKE